jgi:hypothetical protein
MKNLKITPAIAFIFCGCLLAMSACTKLHYEKALSDASQPSNAKRAFNLTSVSKNNKDLKWKEIGGESYVLVSAWKADTVYYKNDVKTGFYNTGKYPIWVTVAPDLQKKLATEKRKYKSQKAMDKRLRQLFGLPPGDKKLYFVEFWVRPADLARPCVDTDVTDNSCELFLPKDATPDCESLMWLANQARASFADSSLYRRYPFTQLGYTYDWNPKNKKHEGLSEFVIGSNRNIVVNKVYKTMDYAYRQ